MFEAYATTQRKGNADGASGMGARPGRNPNTDGPGPRDENKAIRAWASSSKDASARSNRACSVRSLSNLSIATTNSRLRDVCSLSQTIALFLDWQAKEMGCGLQAGRRCLPKAVDYAAFTTSWI